jgi:hypothetical protein
MEDPIHVYKKKDGTETLEIYCDEFAESPREWDNFSKMICFHSRYTLGDKTDLTSDMFDGWDELEEHLMNEEGAVIVAPLYLYDHSGITIKIGSFQGHLAQGHAEFDSGQVGLIYVTKEKMKQEGIDEAKAREIMAGEVDIYDEYLRGNVYMYHLVKENSCDKCGCVTKDILDSCGGFYGYDPKENGIFDNAGIKSDEWEEVK